MARVLELTTRMKAVQRSQGDSATAKAAYRACAVIECERQGRIHNYSRKRGLEVAEIMLPEDAPVWAKDRGKLWNAAEMRETNKDKRAKTKEKATAQTARDYLFTFPDELSAAGRLNAARAVARHLVETHGVAVDFAIHHPGNDGDHRNHHCHMMFTTRRMTAKGLGEKAREWDERSKDEREPSLAKQLRAFVAGTLNAALKAEGKAEAVFVEHRTFKSRGSGQKAQKHLGPGGTHVLRKQQGMARRAWFQQAQTEQSDRHGKELASLKLRQDFALQGKIGELRVRMRDGAQAIRAGVKAARQADPAPDGLRRAFFTFTGRAGREAFDRQTRDAQRVAAARAQIEALKADLRAERNIYVAAQTKDRAALIDRHGAEDRQLKQALTSREGLDRSREVTARQPEQQTQTREREGPTRSIGRDLSPM